MNRLLLMITAVLMSWSVFATEGGKLRFATIFSDNAILQQNSNVKIWGYAQPSQILSLSTSWSKAKLKTTTDSSGRWSIEVSTPKASYTPYIIEVRGENESAKLENVLVGEVWVGSGQSNMEMAMVSAWGPVITAVNEIKSSNNPNIRYITVGKQTQFDPTVEVTTTGWLECSPTTLPDMSAVSYFFAKHLNSRLDVPVGIIVSAYGGTPIESWIAEAFTQNDTYRGKQEELKSEIASGNKNPRNYILSSLYNGMIEPIKNYGIKGWIWYQGESNIGDSERYITMMQHLVASWRAEWGDDQLPFYFAQIAPWQYDKPKLSEMVNSSKWAEMAVAQAKSAKMIANCEMVVLADVGECDNIHPKYKKEVGDRLALAALANDYKQNIKWQSPEPKSIKMENGDIIIRLSNTYAGIHMKSQVNEFHVSADNVTFYKANVKYVANDRIVITCNEVAAPRYVRYCWNDCSVSTIYNSEELPLGPFALEIE